MAEITTKNLRNVCLLGHGGSGKTSLAEAMLFCVGDIARMGKVTDGNTVTDFDPEEAARHYSISLATANLIFNNTKINILDTPGYPDFVGEELEGIRAADAAVIMVDGKGGLEVGTELAWEYVERQNLPRVFFMNKCDDPEASYDRVFGQLKDMFGAKVCPAMVPVDHAGKKTFVSLAENKAYTFDDKGNRAEVAMDAELNAVVDQYKDQFNEAIAGTDEELMMKYFDGEEITPDEAAKALHDGIISGDIVPVYAGSATKLWGVRTIMSAIADSFPLATSKKNETGLVDGNEKPVEIKEDGDVSIFVFKTVVDQFGKMSMFKVMSGCLKKDMALTNSRTGSQEKVAHMYTLKGKKQEEVDTLCCGDIGMLQKLVDTQTNDTLYAGAAVAYKGTEFPEPYMRKAVSAEAKGDEDKISTGIARLLDEDPTLVYENNSETKQLVLAGISDIHLEVVKSVTAQRLYSPSPESHTEKQSRKPLRFRVSIRSSPAVPVSTVM